MGIYTNFAKRNLSGMHVFDAAVLTISAINEKYPPEDKGKVQDGTTVKIVDANGAVLVDDLMVHQNGRKGPKDTTKDAVVISVEKLASLPDDMQLAWSALERVPGGYRDPATLEERGAEIGKS